MSNPENEKTSPMNVSFHPAQQPDPTKPAINPPPAMYGASPSVPYSYQPYAGPPGVVFMQPEQANLMPNVQPVNERDYWSYTILALFCCCPMGILALIYSRKTQQANQKRDIKSAKKYSKQVLAFDHIALALGITWIVLVIAFSVFYIYRKKKD